MNGLSRCKAIRLGTKWPSITPKEINHNTKKLNVLTEEKSILIGAAIWWLVTKKLINLY